MHGRKNSLNWRSHLVKSSTQCNRPYGRLSSAVFPTHPRMAVSKTVRIYRITMSID
ncbi:hypothetical protein SAY86_017450 [Trapa natans]|uniref:Uncharacterized protein n=1 Tax=Trapa natans TaxID=22666 RepID=A0AAN7M563_TRANT|nr:hypothetical protein SAY86_017450 [Trapa natans]